MIQNHFKNMRFYDYLAEKNVDVDTGKQGKKFEKIFTDALELINLKFNQNAAGGAIWDIESKGTGWNLPNEKINIKVSSATWMFASTELGEILPWDKADKNFDDKKLSTKIKRFLNKKGINNVVYLKPKDSKIQNKIISAVKNKDKKLLNNLFSDENFYVEKLGKNYQVRVLSKNNKVSSVAVDKGGSVFMRTERPRKMGGSQNVVAFRAPKAEMGDLRRIKM